MDGIPYLNFDLRIQRADTGYRVQVSSPAGEAAQTFALPFSDLELENFLLRVGRARRATRRVDSPEVAAAKTFGERLFAAVFADEVRGCLRSSIDEAHRQGGGLRIRLHLTDAPELADLPWEYLYNPTLNRFLGLSVETPLVRYLDLPERIRPLLITPPLRVLVMISSPLDHPALDVGRETDKLQEALGDLERRGLVTVERLGEPRLSALQQQLRRGSYHIFHFIGHGGFDAAAQDGVLVLEDAGRRGRLVSGQDLGTLLHDHRSLRLAVLNACEGARPSRSDPFAGAAQSLVQQGLPAVIAMQFEITDEAAITFAHEFYGAVADGYPVDAALGEARKAIFAQGNGLEWGTPVLYLRAPDGRIFDMERIPARRQEQVAVTAAAEVRSRAGAPATARSNLGDLATFLSDPWTILAGITVLLPLVNLLTKVIPLGMWGQDGGFAYFSPLLVTVVATLTALFVMLWTFGQTPVRRTVTGRWLIPPGVSPSLGVGLVALLIYLVGSSLVEGDFYFNVLRWQGDNQLRMLGDILLVICYSAFFALMTRSVVLMGKTEDS